MDTNLLVYAVMPGMREHSAARGWLQARHEDPHELVGFCWPTLYSFVRVVTSRRIMADDAVGLPVAWATATTFLDQANARLVQAGDVHRRIADELLQTPGLTSNDVPDVQLAALAIEHGLTLCSHDRGFARFVRLSWTDPIST